MAAFAVLPAHSQKTMLSTFPDLSLKTTAPQRTLSGQTLVDDEPQIKSLPQCVSYERTLGDSELSYYLPSRESGVNDMYLHLGFRALPHIVQRSRVNLVWTILRVRHPLLASHIEMHAYNDVRFVYDSPPSPAHALLTASTNLEYRTQTKDELLDSYLNGPRTLSNERLSYMIVSFPGSPEDAYESPDEDDNSEPDSCPDETRKECELLICATHYLGDGMALHAFANDFLTLLTGGKTLLELRQQLSEEWSVTCGKGVDSDSVMPVSMESRLPPQTSSRLQQAAAKVDFECSQDKLIGGQNFPRQRGASDRRTIVPTVSFDEAKTKKMLKNCKSHGVSISAALFAICDIAWARLCRPNEEARKLPTMMYSALNMRPYLTKPSASSESYWFLAVGYFNVILPTFLPSSTEAEHQAFWLRAKSAKDQSTKAAKHRFLVDRAREMALVRGARARKWAKEDDDKAAGIYPSPTPSPTVPTHNTTPSPPSRPKVQSSALLGLSLLGNLDGTYKHDTYTGLELHTLTTGSRQRAGGMLLFGYTFKGKLWVSLGYDVNAFEKCTIESWWQGVLDGVEEFLERSE